MSDSLWPRGLQHVRLPCLSLSPRVLLKFMSIESVMPSNHLILCCPSPFRLSSFPASRSFPVSQLFISGGQSIGALASASVLPIYFIHSISSLYSVINLVSSWNAKRHVCFVFSLGQWRWWSFSNLSNLLTQSNPYQTCFEVFWNSCLIKNLCPVLASITCILSPSREESLQR